MHHGSLLFSIADKTAASRLSRHARRPFRASAVFSVPRLENRELSDIFFRLRLDRPEIFYATGFSYRFAPGAERAELLPDYLFEKGKILDHQKALSARVEKLTRSGAVHDRAGKGAVYPRLSLRKRAL